MIVVHELVGVCEPCTNTWQHALIMFKARHTFIGKRNISD